MQHTHSRNNLNYTVIHLWWTLMRFRKSAENRLTAQADQGDFTVLFVQVYPRRLKNQSTRLHENMLS
jgi:hypothetical protein